MVLNCRGSDLGRNAGLEIPIRDPVPGRNLQNRHSCPKRCGEHRTPSNLVRAASLDRPVQQRALSHPKVAETLLAKRPEKLPLASSAGVQQMPSKCPAIVEQFRPEPGLGESLNASSQLRLNIGRCWPKFDHKLDKFD